MYTVRISHVPATGKGPQLRTALEEHSKASNAEGGSYALSQQQYSPEPVFVNTMRYENLAAREAYIAANNEARQVRLAKVAEYLAQPQTAELHQVLLPASPTGEVNYVLGVTYFPAAGKGPEMRAILEERVRDRYPFAGNVGAALGTPVVGEAPSFTLNVLFPDLAGLEEFGKANQTDAAFQASQAKLSGLMSRPVRRELFRVLLPFPA